MEAINTKATTKLIKQGIVANKPKKEIKQSHKNLKSFKEGRQRLKKPWDKYKARNKMLKLIIQIHANSKYPIRFF